MSGVFDHKPCSYGHGIVSQNCLAKEYSDARMEIRPLYTGTFVQVHSVRDDDVVFCVVRDDMEVERNQMICKKVDIINVPENLWGPLFTVKEKSARLSLVRDSKFAESVGNISVGHTVQVLGPDSSIICIASVTFKNSIGRLGVGVYFGLQVLMSKENLQRIIEKVSVLEPGTKGFPRGCDIVVTVDKILPSNYCFSKEKSLGREQECKKDPLSELFSKEANDANCRPAIPRNSNEKRPDGGKNYEDPEAEIRANPDGPLRVGDEVVYLGGDVPEKGLVRCMGLVENSPKVEVKLDDASCGGAVEDMGEFSRTKCQNALIASPTTLIKVSDHLMNTSKEKYYLKKKNNTNNYQNSNINVTNNNNNNSGSSNVNHNNNHNYNNSISNYNNNNYYSNNLNASNNLKTSNSISTSSNHNNNNNNNFSNKSSGSSIGSNTSNSSSGGSTSSSGNNTIGSENCCRYYEFSYDGKQNIEDNYRKSKKSSHCLKHGEASDCFPVASKEEVFGEKDFFKGDHKSDGTFDLGPQSVPRNSDFRERDERKANGKGGGNSVTDDGLVQKESNLHPSAQNPRRAPRSNRSGHDFYDAAGQERERSHRCVGKRPPKCHADDDEFDFFQSSCLRTGERKSWGPHEKEQSILAKKASRESRRGAEGPYDVPPSATRRVHAPEAALPQPKDCRSRQRSEQSSCEESPGDCCGGLGPCPPEDLGRGSVVELSYRGEPHFGVIRWIGTLPDDREAPGPPRLFAGIEMEEEHPDFADGTFNNKRYFQCNPKKALFVPLSECRKDSRFLDEPQKQSPSPKINYGQIDCPIVEGTIPPINREGDLESICGKNRGIQGHHNSCYLDATLFSMFAFTSVFDSLLYRPPTKNDIPQYSEVQRVLREEIVNPLRKNLYVRADRVMKLRTLLEKLSSVSGLTSEEKDPEEFLNSLLAQILKAEPFLKLSSGQEAFHYQLFVEKDERLVLPSVQQLFEQSFLASDIKLKQVPSCLIIQMPRFGKSFKMYSRILPPHLLDVTDIIENSPRQCTVCGKLAEYECRDCFGQQGIGNGLESISFCKKCLDTVHNHHCRSRHNSRALTVPVEFYELQEHCIIPRLYMELFAVVCIETSHYVAFVKCGSGSDAPWCFFDSMADRKGEQNGYNIPEMVPCPDLPFWLSEDGAKMLNELRDERQLTEHAKRLFSDAYMCMYQSPDLMMYR